MSTTEPIKEEAKNIVLCLDGTGDWATFDKTNVMKFYQCLPQSDKQLVYYGGGVGTLGSQMAISKVKQMYLKLLDLATATTIRDQVLDAYYFIVDNYRSGDSIYLFGFSRGAYAARLVASFIHNFGLLTPHNKHLGPYLWQSISGFKTIKEFFHDAHTIKNNFSIEDDKHKPINVPIHFMGLFDTVSSVGIFDRFKVFPFTDKNPSVAHVRHAVSIHESRNAFPELLLRPANNDIEEIWFPGVHRDIGGGATTNPGYENETMNWMAKEAIDKGLTLNFSDLETTPVEMHLGGFDPYVFVGLYPMKMFDYSLSNRLNKKKKRTDMNFSVLKIWRMIRKGDLTDPGFRWYWPNYKHYRKIPGNGFEYLGGGLVGDHSTGKTIPIGQVKNADAPIPQREGESFLGRAWNLFPDFVGITLGVALALLIANRGLGEPLGDSWPQHTSAWAFIFFFVYLVQQGYSHIIKFKWRKDWLNSVVPIIGALGTGLLFRNAGSWPTLLIGLGFGLAIALISLGPTGRKVLHADRVVPLFMVPWVAIMAALWIVPGILQFVVGFLGTVVYWLSMGKVYVQAFPDSVAIAYPMGHSPVTHVLNWNYPAVAIAIAVVAALSGILNIIQDRNKM